MATLTSIISDKYDTMSCQGVTSDHSGWYWCVTHGGEASVFVEVIDDKADNEEEPATVTTEATADVVGITEVIDNLEASLTHIEETTIAAIAENPTTEEVSVKVDMKADEECFLSRTASPPPLTWWPWWPSICSPYTGSYQTSWRGWILWNRNLK